MKITLKSSKLILKVAYINIIALGWSFLINPDSAIHSSLGYYFLLLIFEITWALLLIYITSLLMFINEKTSVTTAFTMYTCFQVINCLYYFLPHIIGRYMDILGIVIPIITLYVAFQAFTRRNKNLSLGFKLFGISMALSVLWRFIVMLAFPQIARNPKNYIEFISFLTSIAVLFIIKRAIAFIENNRESMITAD